MTGCDQESPPFSAWQPRCPGRPFRRPGSKKTRSRARPCERWAGCRSPPDHSPPRPARRVRRPPVAHSAHEDVARDESALRSRSGTRGSRAPPPPLTYEGPSRRGLVGPSGAQARRSGSLQPCSGRSAEIDVAQAAAARPPHEEEAVPTDRRRTELVGSGVQVGARCVVQVYGVAPRPSSPSRLATHRSSWPAPPHGSTRCRGCVRRGLNRTPVQRSRIHAHGIHGIDQAGWAPGRQVRPGDSRHGRERGHNSRRSHQRG